MRKFVSNLHSITMTDLEYTKKFISRTTGAIRGIYTGIPTAVEEKDRPSLAAILP
jgi:hypothetical protein